MPENDNQDENDAEFPLSEYDPSPADIIIGHYRLICTCSACPEQYDVIDDINNTVVGYLRLRHGHFTAEYPDCGGELVYNAATRGDGMFDDDEERMRELTAAVAAISRAHAKPPGA
jgi:hypothetical protein